MGNIDNCPVVYRSNNIWMGLWMGEYEVVDCLMVLD
jgi:hypothetical protein